MKDLLENSSVRVVIVGDSLSLPRREVLPEQTWPALLKASRADLDVFVLSRRGLTTTDLVTEGEDGNGFPPGSDFLEFYRPDVIIVQLGIVDCYPRHFGRGGLERIFLSRLPKEFRNRYITWVKKTRQPSASRAYVSLPIYRKNLENYLDRARAVGVARLILIAIGPVNRSPGEENLAVETQINAYNLVLDTLAMERDWVDFVDPYNRESINKSDFLEDGYHLSALGHRLVFATTAKVLERGGK